MRSVGVEHIPEVKGVRGNPPPPRKMELKKMMHIKPYEQTII
jgi:hypothetical protein